ncbi:MAG TPA: glycoside hydrolase family 3 C-terminal domain-containing protein, partial [Mycobacteriales bacterium]|nr:glycoside hydrolase family 3 C-terminal domain-containing protein [Mycobacteriales bacterium]
VAGAVVLAAGMPAAATAVSGGASMPTVRAEPAGAPCHNRPHWPWCNRQLSPARRAALLEARMTSAEKIGLLNGVSPGVHTGASLAIPRLGIPQVTYSDGPLGPRQGNATAMPAPMAVAASFDPHEAAVSGREIATEAKHKGNDVVFGPTVNIMRTPEGGRSFEAYGEDPFLVSSTAVAWIKGAQRTGVMADVKHFAGNNQEGQLGVAPIAAVDGSRVLVDVHASKRVLHEVYLPQFEAAVKQAHVATVMCSYNRLNGSYACSNSWLLKDTLEKQWGFKGYVLSDYGAAHSTVGNLKGGLDFEPSSIFPVPQLSSYYAPEVQLAVDTGLVKMSVVDEHVRRILRTMFAYGLFDRAPYRIDEAKIDKTADARTSRRVAQHGIVLLRNRRHLLPLRRGAHRSVAVIGPYANTFVTGGGSGDVSPYSTVTALAGIKREAGPHTRVRYADGSNVTAAVAAAKASRVAVVVVGDVESEGQDKSCLGLNCASDLTDTLLPITYPCKQPHCPPNGHDEAGLIRRVAAANPRTVVVLETGAPVLTPWRNQVAAVVEAWYPGEHGGAAIARMLYGRDDPSGRLPATFPAAASQLPTAGSPAKYPGLGVEEYYREGVDVGYRWYDAHHYRPAYPFGYGLSYTSFRYSDLRVHRGGSGRGTVATVSVRVTNIGHRRGTAVPQLYLSLPGSAAVPEPPRQLAGYRSLSLAPGASATVSFHLDGRSFAHYDTAANAWRSSAGCYGVRVGPSSAALPLHATLTEGAAHCAHAALRVRVGGRRANRADVVPFAPTVSDPRRSR